MYSRVFQLHAELLKALSHPKRLEIVHLLRDKTLSVSEIQDMLDLPQANLSQHLMVLRDARVVKTKKQGKQIYYSIAHANFVKASDLLRHILIDRYKGSSLADEFTRSMSELVPIVSDPVCGMRLSPITASFARKHKGTSYYFCASGCMDKFLKHPEAYVAKGA